MGALTYKQFKDKIRRDIWPNPGEPKALRTAHDSAFQSGMLELQKWVKCLQEHNVSVIPACSTVVQCGLTLAPQPNGLIQYVYTLANDDFCDRVFLDKVSHDSMLRYSNELMLEWEAPVDAGLPGLQQGMRPITTALNSKYGRARVGMFSMHNHRIHVGPWLQSNEKLVIEWDGKVELWMDDDILDEELWTSDVMEVLKFHVMWKHELSFGCDRAYRKELKEEWLEQLGDLMYWCKKRQEVPKRAAMPITIRSPTKEELTDDAVVPATVNEIYAANIGDFGTDTQSEADVAALVNGKGVDFITANGDITYLTTEDAYDRGVAKYYAKWIYPYSGSYPAAVPATENKLWVVPGNHDYDVDTPPTSLSSYLAFFSGLPGNKRFYEIVRGPVHFFFLNSRPEEPEGNTATSAQAQWLKAKMMLSTAKWKICVSHDPSYTSASNDTPGLLWNRWPWRDWGCDLLLHGDAHGFERLEVDGLPVVVNGAGGRTITTFGTPIAESKFIYAGFGAGFIRATCTKLTYEFFSIDGTLRDTLTLEK